jgi:hypothetical protein
MPVGKVTDRLFYEKILARIAETGGKTVNVTGCFDEVKR